MHGDVFVLTRCFLQLGDGTIGTNRPAPVDVIGLGSGVANIALGYVRLFCEALALGFLGVTWCAVARVGLLQIAWFAVGRDALLVARVGWGALWCNQDVRGGPHAWFTAAFLCSTKQWGGLLLG